MKNVSCDDSVDFGVNLLLTLRRKHVPINSLGSKSNRTLCYFAKLSVMKCGFVSQNDDLSFRRVFKRPCEVIKQVFFDRREAIIRYRDSRIHVLVIGETHLAPYCFQKPILRREMLHHRTLRQIACVCDHLHTGVGEAVFTKELQRIFDDALLGLLAFCLTGIGFHINLIGTWKKKLNTLFIMTQQNAFPFSIRNVLNAAVVALIATSGAPCLAEAPKEPQSVRTIRVRIPSDAATLDWNKAADPPSVFVVSQLMRGLFRATPDGKVEADLAETYTQSKNLVRIKLRKDLKWSDGQPLLAQHFADSINRMRDPKTASAFANYISFVKSARAKNERDLEIELTKPLTHMNGLLGHPALFPIRKELIEANPKTWTEPANLVVNGPYLLAQHTHDQKLVLKPNPNDFRFSSDVHPIELLPLDSDTTTKNLFDSKRIDLALGVSATTARAAVNVASIPLARLTSVLFNESSQAFKDPKIREALTLATSREDIIKALGFGRAQTSNWVHSQLRSKAASLPDQKTDIARAKAILAKAGFGENKHLPKITLTFPAKDDLQICAEILQDQWSKLGFAVELEGRDPKFFYDGIRTGAIEAALLTWNAGFPSAINYLEVLTSKGPAGALVKNNQYDRLVEELSLLPEGAKRDIKIKNAQAILVSEEHRLIPIFEDAEISFKSPKLEGLVFRSGRARLEELRLKK